MRGTPVWQHWLDEYKDNSFVVRAENLRAGLYLLDVAGKKLDYRRTSLGGGLYELDLARLPEGV